MARKHYISTKDGTRPDNALVRSSAAAAPPETAQPVTLGDKLVTELYFVDGLGNYDATVTGTVRYAVSVPGLSPTGGTFWLGWGTATSGTLTSGKRYQIQSFVAGDNFTNVGAASNATGIVFTASGTTPTTWSNGSTLIEITTDLAYNVSATDLQTAFNLLATVAAAGSVAVSGETPNWLIQFNDFGSRAVIVGNGTALLRDGDVFCGTTQTGTATVRARQNVRLLRKPFVLQDTWTPITNGFRATVDYNTDGLAAYLGDEVSRSDGLTMEVEVTDASSQPRTYLAVPIIARNESVNPLSSVPTPLSTYSTTVESAALYVANAYDITGLTGGGAGNLDGIATTTITTAFKAVKIAGALAFYRLEAGTDAESSPDVIRPDDYNGASNAKVWKLATISVTDLADYESVTFSAAGNTDITPTAGANQHTARVIPTAGAGTYTRTVSVLTANATDGTTCSLRVEMAASVNPTVEIRNATSGGTLLATAAPSATAYTVIYDLVYTGAAWSLVRTFHESLPNQRISSAGFQILDDTDATWRTVRSSGGQLYLA
jgi:hypothetical protein